MGGQVALTPGSYTITMVDQAPDDNTLHLQVDPRSTWRWGRLSRPGRRAAGHDGLARADSGGSGRLSGAVLDDRDRD